MTALLTRHSAAQNARSDFILWTMCLGVLIAQIDTAVVNLAVRAIGADLRLDVSALQWVVDAYNLVYAGLLLTAGMLGDRYGHRRIFVAGMIVFALGSLICGLAPGGGALIAGRAVAGLGAALELPASLAILSVVYGDAAKRAHAIGVWASCYGLAMIIGPTAGGLLVDTVGWRSIFLLILPFCALAVALALRLVPDTADRADRPLDPAGQTLAIAALGALSFTMIEGPSWRWTSLAFFAGLAIALAAALAFVRTQAGNPRALVPLELFAHRPFSASMAVAGLMTFGMYAMLFLVPLYLQVVRGASAFIAGLELIPMSLIFLLVSQRSGAIATALGPRRVMAAGMALMGAGLLLLAGIAPDSGIGSIELALIVIGIGLGLNAGPVVAVAVASVPAARSGMASGLVNTARMVGATVGVAVLGAVFAAHAGQHAAAARFIGGLHLAFSGGAAAEFLGALLALAFIRRDSLQRK
jgi:EmrB/QacA subfamily drug resistance transporter